MTPRRRITHEGAAEIFEEAVRERALAVLSVHAADEWHTFKSRFLECDPAHAFFVLDYQALDGDSLPEIWPGQCVGVSFRHRNRKVLFATVVEARGHFMVEEQRSIPALRYRWPDSITELQRRAYYRTPVPETMTLLAALWTGGLSGRPRAQAQPLQVVTGSLANLSCGGALVRLAQPCTQEWSENETLGVELQLGDGRPPALLDAYFRGLRHDPLAQSCVALQFIGLEMSVDGRLVLQRLAAAVQRLHRLGSSSGLRNWNSRPEQPE